MPPRSKPINEAGDIELLEAFKTDVIDPIIEAWPKAIEASQKIITESKNKPQDAILADLGQAWKPVFDKFASIEYVLDHLKFRVANVRGRGILPGDPREDKLLAEDLGY